MADFHNKQLGFELKRLQKRLNDPRVHAAIMHNPSFEVQRTNQRSVEQLQGRVEHVLYQVENRYTVWGRVRRFFFVEGDLDSKVGRLETEAERLFKTLGVQGV